MNLFFCVPRGLHIPAVMTQNSSIVCSLSDTLCESPAELWSHLQGLSFYDVLYPWQCLGIHQMDPCLSPISAVSQVRAAAERAERKSIERHGTRSVKHRLQSSLPIGDMILRYRPNSSEALNYQSTLSSFCTQTWKHLYYHIKKGRMIEGAGLRGGSCHKNRTRLAGMFHSEGCRWLISLTSDCNGVYCLFRNWCARCRATVCLNVSFECVWYWL